MRDKRKIYVNMVRCQKCGDVIVSQSVHDFKYCTCGSISVDGGKDYLKRMGDLDAYDELSQYEEETPSVEREQIEWNKKYLMQWINAIK